MVNNMRDIFGHQIKKFSLKSYVLVGTKIEHLRGPFIGINLMENFNNLF